MATFDDVIERSREYVFILGDVIWTYISESELGIGPKILVLACLGFMAFLLLLRSLQLAEKLIGEINLVLDWTKTRLARLRTILARLRRGLVLWFIRLVRKCGGVVKETR